MTPVSPPVALSIAGSDCSAGAGLQADLKTMTAFGVYGLTAVTCVVAEVPGRVTRILPVEPELIDEQIRLLLEAFPVAAVKTGMLHSAACVSVVAERLRRVPAERRPWLVVDPVMIATSGDPLIETDAVEALKSELFPLADVITPNMDEAGALLGWQVSSPACLDRAAEELRDRFGCAALVKGGHLRGEVALDVLAEADGLDTLAAPFIPGVSTHGTGCTCSAAIAAGLARGHSLREAVREAKTFVTEAIRRLCRWQGVDALNHGDSCGR